jgi:hypothetical protein
MFKSVDTATTPLSQRLIQLWGNRYIPDLSTFSSEERYLNVSELLTAASPAGRAKTADKVEQRLLKTKCEYAGIETNSLFSYIPNIVNLAEAKRLAQYAWQVYAKAIDIYKQQSPQLDSMGAEIPTSGGLLDLHDPLSQLPILPTLEMPAIEQLATALEPLLLRLQEQHLLAKDRRTIGFITTQFHFSTKLILRKLTLPEQVLISPYFRFVEEQVCIPWQRVCAAAAQQVPGSPILAIVEKLLAESDAIAKAVYHRSVQLYPNHRSRRGKLTHPGITASTLRDLSMFQGYLWLCVLEENMTSVEHELLPLCVMVFPSVEVKWELVNDMLKLLTEELCDRMTPQEASLILPYTEAMEHLFSNVDNQ